MTPRAALGALFGLSALLMVSCVLVSWTAIRERVPRSPVTAELRPRTPSCESQSLPFPSLPA